METSQIWLLSGFILLAALLYSSVGHGGASAYLAVMARFNSQHYQICLGAAIGFIGSASTFILINSVVSIIGHFSKTQFPPVYIWYFIATASIGGLIGSHLGSKRLANQGITQVLGVLMLISGVHLAAVPVYKYFKKNI